MSKQINRRNFSKLSVAALGGMVAGVSVADGKTVAAEKVSYLLQEPHVCKGLNTCKGKGSCGTSENDCKGHNQCAGTGGCPTAEKHSCHKANKCKGQGGCGTTAGLNECKGQGECSVPLGEKTWKKVRKQYETAMTKAKKKFGEAPKKKA